MRSELDENPARAWFTWLVFGFITAVYVWEAPAQPAWGDGLSFLYSSEAGFDLDTNATSHFLYRNLCYLLASALGFWPNAGVLVGLSVASALVVLLLAYRLARVVADQAGALFSVGVLGLAFTFWRHAVTIEVYAFNLVFVTAIMLVAVRGIVRKDGRHAAVLGVLWGLALLLHIQNILLAPLAVYYLWCARPAIQRLAVSVGLFVAMASPLVVLPFALGAHDVGAVLAESRSGGLLETNPASIAKEVLLSAAYLVYNFHIWLIPIVVGAGRLWRSRAKIAWALLLVAGPYWLFATSFPVSDSYVFYLCAYVCAVPCAAVGFDALLSRAWAKTRRYSVMISLVVGPLIYATAVQVAQTANLGQGIEQAKGYKGGLRFYLYPGMRGSPNPLDLAREIQTGQPEEQADWDPEWAIRYLELEARSH